MDTSCAISGARESVLPTDVPESITLPAILCTDAATNINGWDFIVGGGEISLVSLPDKERTIYCEDHWTVDQLEKLFPRTLGAGLHHPALE